MVPCFQFTVRVRSFNRCQFVLSTVEYIVVIWTNLFAQVTAWYYLLYLRVHNAPSSFQHCPICKLPLLKSFWLCWYHFYKGDEAVNRGSTVVQYDKSRSKAFLAEAHFIKWHIWVKAANIISDMEMRQQYQVNNYLIESYRFWSMLINMS